MREGVLGMGHSWGLVTPVTHQHCPFTLWTLMHDPVLRWAPEPGHERSLNQAQRENLVTSRPRTETGSGFTDSGTLCRLSGSVPNKAASGYHIFQLARPHATWELPGEAE